MKTVYVVVVLAFTVVVLTDSIVAAQSIFGGRGPISGPTGTRRPFSPVASQGTYSPAGDAAAAAAGTSGGFVGRGRPQGNFIGARQSNQQGSAATTRRRPIQPRPTGGNPTTSETAQGPATNLRAAGASSRPVRARERIAFPYTARQPAAIQADLVSQFAVLAHRFPLLEGVDIEANTDGQFTLRGEVSSEEDRQLIEMIARMQPGVRSVRNELAIAGTPRRQPDKSDLP